MLDKLVAAAERQEAKPKAAKLRDDIYYSNAYYSSIGGVSNSEINTLELEFLTQIGWETWVEPAEYDAYVQALWSRFGPSIAGATTT